MWLRYFDGPDEIIEKITYVKKSLRGEYSYITVNQHYFINCTSAEGCKIFFGEIVSRLNDPNAIIWDDDIINFEDSEI